MPIARKMTKIGMPSLEENELSKMLAATNRAPIKKSVLIVLASKSVLLVKHEWRGGGGVVISDNAFNLSGK
jgi:hypothetical protein